MIALLADETVTFFCLVVQDGGLPGHVQNGSGTERLCVSMIFSVFFLSLQHQKYEKTSFQVVLPAIDLLLINGMSESRMVLPFLTPLSVKPCEHAKNFHKQHISKTAFYYFWNISEVRCFLSQSVSEKLVRTFISSRLDYCNALFTGLTKQVLNKLLLYKSLFKMLQPEF